MTIAALILFGGLLLAWLLVPAERRQRRPEAPQRIAELPADAAA